MAHPAVHMNGANRLASVQNRGNCRRVGDGEEVDQRRRKTEGRESSAEVGVRDTVVGFVLVQEEKDPVGRMVVSVAEDRADVLGDIRSLPPSDETSLRRVDERGKNLSEAISKKFRKDLGVAIRELDGAPISNVSRRAVGFGNKSQEGTLPGKRRSRAGKNVIEQGEKSRSNVR